MSKEKGKDGHYMKCSNRLLIIIGVVIIAVALVCCALLLSRGDDESRAEGANPTDTTTQTPTSETTVPEGSNVIPPAVVIPDTTDPHQTEEGDSFVESDEKTDAEIEEPVEEGEKKDVIIVEEDTGVSEEKDDVQIDGDNSDSDDNTPEYEQSPGGDNPFDNDIETEIDDTPVEDYIGEGEDRPGEGIHF